MDAVEPGQHLEAVDVGHLDVEHGEVHPLGGQEVECRLAVGGLEHAIALLLERVPVELPHTRLVVHHEHCPHDASPLPKGAGGVFRWGASGRVKRKALPRSGALSTQILPPCASTAILQKARPMPAPPMPL